MFNQFFSLHKWQPLVPSFKSSLIHWIFVTNCNNASMIIGVASIFVLGFYHGVEIIWSLSCKQSFTQHCYNAYEIFCKI